MKIIAFLMTCLGERGVNHYASLKAEIEEEIRNERNALLARLLVLNGIME